MRRGRHRHSQARRRGAGLCRRALDPPPRRQCAARQSAHHRRRDRVRARRAECRRTVPAHAPPGLRVLRRRGFRGRHRRAPHPGGRRGVHRAVDVSSWRPARRTCSRSTRRSSTSATTTCSCRTPRAAATWATRARSASRPARSKLAHRAFSPTAREREYAQRLVAAYAAATARGIGTIDFEGRMIDGPLLKRAQAVLAAPAGAA